MRYLIAIWLLLVLASSALAETTEEGVRVTGQDDAAGATIILNELNIENYPDVLILATVLKNGQPVSGLTAEDFRVREDEVNQEPLTVEPELPPLSVVVALDTSGSMAERMAETRSAAKLFVESLSERDSVQLLRFARDIEAATPMISNKTQVSDAIDTVTARGDTALYDALYQSVELLADRPGRRAVVLLSDGVDDDGTGQPLSEKTVDDVLERAKSVGAPVFAIGLGTEMDEAVLSHIADRTGAQYLNAPGASELSRVYGQISDQLTGQYAIRYVSSLPADGTERRVDLAALDAQDSKTYRAEGEVAAESTSSGSAEGVCAPMQVVEAEATGLQQSKERYEQDLISVTDRNAVRSDAMGRIEDELAASSIDIACIRAVLETAKTFYDEDLIAVTHRDAIRRELESPLSDTCTLEPTVERYLVCLRFFRDAYDEDLIPATMRNQFRAEFFEKLVELYATDLSTDEALAEVNGLYEEDLISVSERDDGREQLLSAEGD